MNDETEHQILTSKIATLDRYIAVINRIRTYREPEESACAALGVDVQTYRKVMALLPKEQEFIRYDMWAKWEDRLLTDICMEPCQAPETFRHILGSICSKEGYYREYNILESYYKNGMSCLEIGEQLNYSASWIRRQIDQILCLLRRPQYRAMLRYGDQYPKLQEYIASQQTEYEKNLEKTMQETLQNQKKQVQDMEERLLTIRKEQEVAKIGQEASDRNDILRKTSVTDMGFSLRTQNSLKRSGIDTAYKIVAMSQKQLLEIHNLGSKSCREICDRMFEKYGIEIPRTPGQIK